MFISISHAARSKRNKTAHVQIASLCNNSRVFALEVESIYIVAEIVEPLRLIFN